MGAIGRFTEAIGAVKEKGQAWCRQFRVDLGGGESITCGQFSPAGEDANPLPTDIPLIVPTPQSGRGQVAGFIDPLNEPEAQPGEKKVYGRNLSGEIVNWVLLKNDGSLEVQNANGHINMAPDGSINLNGVIITAAGQIIAPSTIEAAGGIMGLTIASTTGDITLHTHTHPDNGDPPTPGS